MLKKFLFKGSSMKNMSDLVKAKEEILTCMADNIDDRNSSTSLRELMSVVDLFSNETFDQRNKNRYNLFNLYVHDTAYKL